MAEQFGGALSTIEQAERTTITAITISMHNNRYVAEHSCVRVFVTLGERAA